MRLGGQRALVRVTRARCHTPHPAATAGRECVHSRSTDRPENDIIGTDHFLWGGGPPPTGRAKSASPAV